MSLRTAAVLEASAWRPDVLAVGGRVGQCRDGAKVARSTFAQNDGHRRRGIVRGVGKSLSLACCDRAGDARAILAVSVAHELASEGSSKDPN